MKKSTLPSLVGGLATISQLGLSLILPLLGFTLGGAYLYTVRGVGFWVVILGLVLGLGTAASAFIRFVRVAQRQAQKEEIPPLCDKTDEKKEEEL